MNKDVSGQAFSLEALRKGDRAEFAPFLELDHLRVMVAQPEYLLAMKCIAMRIGAEFHDEDDVRFLLRWLNVDSSPERCLHRTRGGGK